MEKRKVYTCIHTFGRPLHANEASVANGRVYMRSSAAIHEIHDLPTAYCVLYMSRSGLPVRVQVLYPLGLWSRLSKLVKVLFGYG